MALEKREPLDALVHSYVHIVILSILVTVESADFKYLKDAIRVMDGLLLFVRTGYLISIINGQWKTEHCHVSGAPKSPFTRP